MRVGRTVSIAGMTLAAVVLAGAAGPARAQTRAAADSLRTGGPGTPFARPAPIQLPTAPALADPPSIASSLLRPGDWILGGLFLGSFAATEIEGVEEIDEVIAPRPGDRGAAHRWIGRNYGRLEVISALSGATFLVGAATGSEATARVGLRSLEALLVNTGLTTVLKVGFGRSRPYTGSDEDRYRPFTWSRDEWSFPSGHTSNVFAIATTLSLELGDDAPWLPFVVYPLAGWTGLSRILDEKHYFTDVLAGAAVGILSARLVHRFHERTELPAYRAPGSGVTPRLLLSAGSELLVGVRLAF